MKTFGVAFGIVVCLLVFSFGTSGRGEVGDEYPELTLADKSVTFKKAIITAIEPDGIRIRHDSGLAKIPFEKLPSEIREKYGFDPDSAKSFREAEQHRQREALTAAEHQRQVAAEREKELHRAHEQTTKQRKLITSAQVKNYWLYRLQQSLPSKTHRDYFKMKEKNDSIAAQINGGELNTEAESFAAEYNISVLMEQGRTDEASQMETRFQTLKRVAQQEAAARAEQQRYEEMANEMRLWRDDMASYLSSIGSAVRGLGY